MYDMQPPLVCGILPMVLHCHRRSPCILASQSDIEPQIRELLYPLRSYDTRHLHSALVQVASPLFPHEVSVVACMCVSSRLAYARCRPRACRHGGACSCKAMSSGEFAHFRYDETHFLPGSEHISRMQMRYLCLQSTLRPTHL